MAVYGYENPITEANIRKANARNAVLASVIGSIQQYKSKDLTNATNQLNLEKLRAEINKMQAQSEEAYGNALKYRSDAAKGVPEADILEQQAEAQRNLPGLINDYYRLQAENEDGAYNGALVQLRGQIRSEGLKLPEGQGKNLIESYPDIFTSGSTVRSQIDAQGRIESAGISADAQRDAADIRGRYGLQEVLSRNEADIIREGMRIRGTYVLDQVKANRITAGDAIKAFSTIANTSSDEARKLQEVLVIDKQQLETFELTLSENPGDENLAEIVKTIRKRVEDGEKAIRDKTEEAQVARNQLGFLGRGFGTKDIANMIHMIDALPQRRSNQTSEQWTNEAMRIMGIGENDEMDEELARKLAIRLHEEFPEEDLDK